MSHSLRQQNFNGFAQVVGFCIVLPHRYKPSINGQAERVVPILKSAIRQALITNADVAAVIANYLLVYGTTSHSITGEPPSMLLMDQRLRTRLDLLTPSFENYVENRQ